MSDDEEEPRLDRRAFLAGGSVALAGAALASAGEAEAQQRSSSGPSTLIVPNGSVLPFQRSGDTKVFHLRAEVFENRFTENLVAECWGYNGSTPGPVIEATDGDRLRIYVTNRLREPTTVHWHGLFVPSGMDGVGGLTQPYIQPGQTYRYELTMNRPGTFMYHSHYDEMTQIALGAVGMIVVHPRAPRGPRPDKQFVLMLHEWTIPIGARRPNPLAMNDFNVLTINGKCFPATDPLVVERGERVRIRFGNLGPMDHHPIHLHGYAWKIVATDGGEIAPSAQWPETTVLVPVGSTRDVEFVANEPGDWAMHCHMTHHIMNQMGHDFPNVTGLRPDEIDARMQAIVPGYMTMGHRGMGGMASMGMPVPDNSIPMVGGPGPYGEIDMGGMFTILKVRERGQRDVEWYAPPDGTLAREATEAELREDGIEP
ncbi:MAG: multicopper oxidase family protein [Sandaracinaceae bacterium]